MSTSILGFINLVVMMTNAIPSPLYPEYAKQWHLSPAILSYVYASYPIGVMVALSPAGWLSDRYGRRIAIIGAVVNAAGSDLLFIVAHNAGALIGARALTGFAVALVTSAVAPALTELTRGRDTKTPALITMTTLVSGFCVGGLVSALALHFNLAPLRAPWVLHALLTVLALALSLFAVSSNRKRSGLVSHSVMVPIVLPQGVPPFLGACAALFCAFATMGFFLAFAQGIVMDQLKLREPLYGSLVLAVFLISSLVAQLSMRRLVDRNAIPAGLTAAVLGLAIVVIASLGVPWALIGATILGGGGCGIAQRGSLAMANRLASPERRGAALARYYLIGYLGTTSPFIVGIASPTNGFVRASILFASFIAVIASTAMILARRRCDTHQGDLPNVGDVAS